MLNLFTSAAYAQTQSATQQPAMWEMIVMPVGFLAIMYFFMIRPQQKRARDQQAFMTGLKAGDEVVTSGGIIGKIKTVQEGFVSLEVSANTVIKVVKSEVASTTQKLTAVEKKS